MSIYVAPRVGAWIEKIIYFIMRLGCLVAPRVGAWIEKQLTMTTLTHLLVAPRVGAWIEKTISPLCDEQTYSRSSRRSVD